MREHGIEVEKKLDSDEFNICGLAMKHKGCGGKIAVQIYYEGPDVHHGGGKSRLTERPSPTHADYDSFSPMLELVCKRCDWQLNIFSDSTANLTSTAIDGKERKIGDVTVTRA